MRTGILTTERVFDDRVHRHIGYVADRHIADGLIVFLRDCRYHFVGAMPYDSVGGIDSDDERPRTAPKARAETPAAGKRWPDRNRPRSLFATLRVSLRRTSANRHCPCQTSSRRRHVPGGMNARERFTYAIVSAIAWACSCPMKKHFIRACPARSATRRGDIADIEEVVFVVVRQIPFHLRRSIPHTLCDVDDRQVQRREDITSIPSGSPEDI